MSEDRFAATQRLLEDVSLRVTELMAMGPKVDALMGDRRSDKIDLRAIAMELASMRDSHHDVGTHYFQSVDHFSRSLADMNTRLNAIESTISGIAAHEAKASGAFRQGMASLGADVADVKAETADLVVAKEDLADIVDSVKAETAELRQADEGLILALGEHRFTIESINSEVADARAVEAELKERAARNSMRVTKQDETIQQHEVKLDKHEKHISMLRRVVGSKGFIAVAGWVAGFLSQYGPTIYYWVRGH